jgi:hypothetical protein
MRTLSILIAAAAVLSLGSAFTAAQSATSSGVTNTSPRLGTTDTTHLYLAAKTKKRGAKSYGFCPPGQAKKPGRGSAFRR